MPTTTTFETGQKTDAENQNESSTVYLLGCPPFSSRVLAQEAVAKVKLKFETRHFDTV